MPPSPARPNLQSLSANATKDLPGMARFATEITARLPLRLPDNLDLDIFVDSSCEALWALHDFIKKSSNSPVVLHRLPFLSKILEHVSTCLQLYMDRILRPGDVSRYPRDCYRISVLVLYDLIWVKESSEELLSRLVHLRCTTGDSTVVGSIVPDLLLYLPPSVSYTTESRHVFYELTSILFNIIQHDRFNIERPWCREILPRLSRKPDHVVSSIERTIHEASQTLSVAATGEDFLACLAQFATAYCTIQLLSDADSCFLPYAFSPASRRRVLEVAWKVSHSKFLIQPSSSRRPQLPVDHLIQFGVAVGKFIYTAVTVVGREMVKAALRHRVLESYFILQSALNGATSTDFPVTVVGELAQDIAESMIPYFIYPSIRRDGLHCRTKMEATAGHRGAYASFNSALDDPRYSVAREVLTLCDAKTLCPNLFKLTRRRARCSNCKVTFYCSRECQKQHWKSVHRRQCESFRQERIDAQEAVQRNSGFLPALDAEFICSFVHDILREYPIHLPPWKAVVDMTSAEPKILYEPMDTDELGSCGLSDWNTLPGIYVIVLLPAGSLYRNFSAGCMLSAHWLKSETAVYWSGMTRSDASSFSPVILLR